MGRGAYMICDRYLWCVFDLVMSRRSPVLLFLLLFAGPMIYVASGQTPTLTAASPTQAVSGGAASVTLTGTGFVPGTVLTSSVGTVTTTYNSAKSITAQLTLPTGATGNVTLQATNPAPGGTSAAYQLPIATLQETATDPDGTNIGTARLGVP